ncbi:hypothetical protein FEM48_Zijuj02G0048500 [Ziziphus jujuba var. spinosa]|uniref:Pentatricopeptide repeat-containing protein n=1 Tax=Ziziphus jujuba var. spinosa TaxID=714518 RepID=A0A978VTR0_ZIZJJ|nr:hypothetical protein FEM48_Zijuj02G0048500 [Ziziphus jujuba var. spinosa]
MDTGKLILLLKACISSKTVLQGKLIHQKIVSLGLQNNTTLCKNLINFYFSCRLYDYGSLVFDSVKNPFDISLWNCLLAAYTKNFMFIEALQLFESLKGDSKSCIELLRRMIDEGTKPTLTTLSSMLMASSRAKSDIIDREFYIEVVISFEFKQALIECHRRMPVGPARESACRHLNRATAQCLVSMACPEECEAVRSLCSSSGTALKRSQCQAAQVSLSVCLSSCQLSNPSL